MGITIDPTRRTMRSEKMTPTLTVMPDYGNAPFLWMDGCVCDGGYWHESHPLSEGLWRKFADWAIAFDQTTPMLDNPCWQDWDWIEFHHRGRQLAGWLKAEVGEEYRVVYVKASEDPNNAVDERCEMMLDGSSQVIPSPRGLWAEPIRLVSRIVSGGQAGVDRAALDYAIEHGYPHGGYCPKGRVAEDGPIPMRYQLIENDSAGYRQRTRRNIDESDATLLLNVGELDGGSLETQRIAEQLGKPVLVIPLDRALPEADECFLVALTWIRDGRVHSLNVAGPRASKRPGIYELALAFLKGLDGRNHDSCVAIEASARVTKPG